MIRTFGNGRLTREPELRNTQSGDSVCSIDVACNEGFGDRQTTIFLRIEAWGKVAEACAEHLTKGQEIFFTGNLERDEYTSKSGEKKTALRVKFPAIEFGAKPRGQQQDAEPRHENRTPYQDEPGAEPEPRREDSGGTEDDLPF